MLDKTLLLVMKCFALLQDLSLTDLLWAVRCGVVWCGVVWCGVMWCGVGWCNVV